MRPGAPLQSDTRYVRWLYQSPASPCFHFLIMHRAYTHTNRITSIFWPFKEGFPTPASYGPSLWLSEWFNRLLARDFIDVQSTPHGRLHGTADRLKRDRERESLNTSSRRQRVFKLKIFRILHFLGFSVPNSQMVHGFQISKAAELLQMLTMCSLLARAPEPPLRSVPMFRTAGTTFTWGALWWHLNFKWDMHKKSRKGGDFIPRLRWGWGGLSNIDLALTYTGINSDAQGNKQT